MTPRFNPDRDHGTISPFWHGAGFHQDGAYFSPQGDYLFSDGDDPTSPRKVAPAKKVAPAPTSETEPLPKPTVTFAGETSQEADQGAQEPAGDIDLVAWYRGELKAPFFSVRKAILARFPDAEVKSAVGAKQVLIDHDVI